MLLNTANLNMMFTAFSLQYQGGYGRAEIFWRSLATLVASSSESMTYAWMDRIPKLRKWIGPKQPKNLAARGPRVVINDPFELTVEVPKHKIQDDTYGIFAPFAADMGFQASKWPDDVVAAKLLENPLSFDGKAFFADDHPINLDDAGAGTYQNYYSTGKALTNTNFGFAKKEFRKFKGADGRPIGARGTLLIVPPSLEETAKIILNADYHPGLADGASLGNGDVGQQYNVWKGGAELLVVDELEDEPTAWYLFDTTKAIMPLIFQLREAPVFTALTAPSDPNVFWAGNFVMGIEARGAADVTLPFLAMKFKA